MDINGELPEQVVHMRPRTRAAIGGEFVPGKRGESRRKSGAGINLKTVADALVEAGLDPTVELLRIAPTLDPQMQARIYMELLEYTQPKLKSMEVKRQDVVRYVIEAPPMLTADAWQAAAKQITKQ